MASPRSWGTVVGAGVAVAALLAVPATAQGGADPVPDPLERGGTPTAAEIADSITPIEPDVRELEPDVRSLRDERQEGELEVVSIASDVLFAFDSDELSARAEATVRELAAELADVQGTVTVVGHTDSVGSDDYNQDLSERRAASVAAVLAAELGDDIEVVTAGRGSSEPVARESEDDPSAAARNRRVEISFDR